MPRPLLARPCAPLSALRLALAVLSWLACPLASAQAPAELMGRPIVLVDVEGDRTDLMDASDLGIDLGSPLTRALLRAVTLDLIATERWADVRIDAAAHESGARLRVILTRRTVISRIDVIGNSALSGTGVLTAIDLQPGDEIASGRTEPIRAALEDAYRELGYDQTQIEVALRDTSETERRVLRIVIVENEPTRVVDVRFEPDAPPDGVDVGSALGLDIGAVFDRRRIEPADRALETALRAAGHLEAVVGDIITESTEGGVRLRVPCRVGRRYRVVIDGHAPLSAEDVDGVLRLSEERLRAASLEAIRGRVVDLYRRHGFLDASVELRRTTDPDYPEDDSRAVLAVLVRTGDPVRVVGVSFPGAEHFPSDVLRDQVRSYLQEELPHAALTEPVDSGVLDLIGVSGRPSTAARSVAPIHEDLPDTVWYEPLYVEAVEHIRTLYESEGYLSAEIGAPELVRLERGEAIVTILVREGPRTLLFDVSVEGNVEIGSAELLDLTGLERGAAFSRLAVEEARTRMTDLYRERGYLFARVDAAPHLSADASRAEVIFEVVERFQVRIGGIRVEGCERTDPDLVLGTLELRVGDVFRPSSARQDEEALLATGIFSSARITTDTPDLAEQVKTIVVTVRERTAQELGLSAGISTGEGARGSFEYAYRNLFGWGLTLSFRTHLAIQFLFQDSELEQAILRLSAQDRLERRITLSLNIPHIPGIRNVRLGLDLVHLRDNFRDFGLDKNGFVLAATWIPIRRLTLTLSGEIEHNDVGIFQREVLEQLLGRLDQRTQRLLRVPEGESAIGSARLSAVVDLRDNAFTPTDGIYATASAEWARTVGSSSEVDCAIDVHTEAPEGVLRFPRTCLDERGSPSGFFSHFLKLSLSVSGYIPLAEGWVVALQARTGRVFHLENGSRTYPNRVFYLGGVDSMRGYLQDQVIPQDQFDALLRAGESVTTAVVRTGDFFLLFRAELRFPIIGDLGGGLFVDAGNVWANADAMRLDDYFRLRFNAGVGLRYATPVGPLAIDYGFNLTRQADEPIGAFHFSIGLF